MFAPNDAYRKQKFEDVCIPTTKELFYRYGQLVGSPGSNDGNDFSESESSMRLSKVEMVMKAREIAAQLEPEE